MGKENVIIRIQIFLTMANLLMVWLVVKDRLFITMVRFYKVNGKMAKRMENLITYMKTVSKNKKFIKIIK